MLDIHEEDAPLPSFFRRVAPYVLGDYSQLCAWCYGDNDNGMRWSIPRKATQQHHGRIDEMSTMCSL